MKLTRFSQEEYSRLLDSHRARQRALSQGECEHLLITAGASYEQAKNGAYVYLHHGSHVTATRRASQSEYDGILNKFGARSKQPQECIQHLEGLGFSYGQAKTAVYKYRVNHGLIGRS